MQRETWTNEHTIYRYTCASVKWQRFGSVAKPKQVGKRLNKYLAMKVKVVYQPSSRPTEHEVHNSRVSPTDYEYMGEYSART